MIPIPDVVIDDSDLKEQIRLLERLDEIGARHLRPVMEQSIQEVASDWRSQIPTVSGEYQGSIEAKVRSVVGLRARAVASTDVRRDGKFPYPAALETSPSAGRAVRTYIWQSGRLARGTVGRVLKDKANEIQQRVFEALLRILDELVVR